MQSLKTEHLQIAYGSQLVIKDLSISLPQGKITAIIGSNGCGKSTFLKAISRIIPIQAGSVLLDGKEIRLQSTKILAQKMAILPQIPEAVEGLTVGELVACGRFPYQKGFGRMSKYDLDYVNWALESTGIAHLKHRDVEALSGGQRQRVWIAMALAQETSIILLDEPTTYLDLCHQLEIMQLLEQLNRTEKKTIIMVLHDLNHAARFADYMIALKEGIVVKAGQPSEVMTTAVLAEVFSIDAQIGKDPRTQKPVCLTYDLLPEQVEQKQISL
ncbi:iron complex transport system ATP-binding protein [Seinonella peptonophila]|uniref:Iron complex transport system ATP-binding protein n=1 Tax=Seinonella peptonophila TaxID=112248 RepID=A0A1M4X6Y1_9BACL|nr:ABC transporter ATP-binding protein [Seinonella peptonophila]SHE89207.1 iron complex transport system ATP-binding protein [Seinonella peptonophila]